MRFGDLTLIDNVIDQLPRDRECSQFQMARRAIYTRCGTTAIVFDWYTRNWRRGGGRAEDGQHDHECTNITDVIETLVKARLSESGCLHGRRVSLPRRPIAQGMLGYCWTPLWPKFVPGSRIPFGFVGVAHCQRILFVLLLLLLFLVLLQLLQHRL